MASGAGGDMLVTLQGGAVGHLLMTVSLPDHVLSTGPDEVDGEVFGVPWRVCPSFIGLAEI